MDAASLLRTLDAEAQSRLPSEDGRPRLAFSSRLPARTARVEDFPADLAGLLHERLALRGIERLYLHQAEALDHARNGRHVVVATGTASGKSLCYQLPIVERLLQDEHATALYLSPTKALAQDQLRAFRDFRLPHLRAATYDGDTPRGERDAVRRTANIVLSNPDMLHAGILPAHRRWGDFLHRLAFVVVDECHVARGVFGSHVGVLLRRLRRIAAYYGAEPTFVLASATIGNPGEHAHNLTGLDVAEVVIDGAPKPPMVLGMWEPALLDITTGARRSTLSESAELLAGLVEAGPATIAFVKSRKGAEIVAAAAQRAGAAVLAYRAGYLPEERRAIETSLVDGSLRGVAATDALELGVDIGSLDAVVISGWPGTAASLWQQAGRAGRRGQEAIVVFVAEDNPLDHYLLAHPIELWERPLEAAVIDVTNPYILGPHLRCAAWELPLELDEQLFPEGAEALIAADLADGLLRERGGRRYWAGRTSPATAVNIRSTGGEPFLIVEAGTGALVGDVDQARAFRTVHPGAIYLHQGQAYRIVELDLSQHVAMAQRYDGDEYSVPRSDTDISVTAVVESEPWGACRWERGRVEVTNRVLAYERRRLSSEQSLGLVELDLPPLHLDTHAFWVTIPGAVLGLAELSPAQVPGAAHAAEHAAIGMLPLFAMCDRWDIGGVSTPWHPDTGEATIFVYDGYPGGAGITERGFREGTMLLRATLATIAACRCAEGCPSCVQSPKCGNGNEPLDKAGATRLLEAILSGS